MTRFTEQCIRPAPVIAGLYRDMRDVTGRSSPANFFTAMAVRPDLMAATWNLLKILFTRGRLPPHVTQLMVLAISDRAGCRYRTRRTRHAYRTNT